jgi:hypothetical protein
MKAVLLLPTIACLFLAGCGKDGGDTGKPTNETSSVITAPVDYLGAVGRAQQASIKSIDLSTLKHAIQMFQVEQDRFPKDLNELAQMKYIGEVPKAPHGQKIVYDASTGSVNVVPE